MVKIIMLILVLLVTTLHGRCKIKSSEIPPNAYLYLDDMYKEFNRLNIDISRPWYFGALIEHESCITLCRKRCWSPTSRLKTKREEGAGLPQLTRAYNRYGKLRFDIIHTLRRKHPKELSELNWNNVYNRPDLQMRAMMLLWKEPMYRFKNKVSDITVINFLDSIYNGGLKYFLRERKSCYLRANCDETKWFNNVARMNARGHRVLYGNRTAHMINRHHVSDVRKKMNKYKKDYILNNRDSD